MRGRLIGIALAVILARGEWVTTEDGARVCRAAYDIQTYMPLTSSMCEDWQPGMTRPIYGQSVYPFRSWLRRRPGTTMVFGGFQIHTEQGWRP